MIRAVISEGIARLAVWNWVCRDRIRLYQQHRLRITRSYVEREASEVPDHSDPAPKL